MLTSLALIFLVGLSMAAICKAIKLPRIIGMLITGVVLGPYVLDLFDSSILGISSELRQMALVIILIKAGLSLNLKDLKKVGRPAILLAFLPAVFEIGACVVFAPLILKVNYIEAAIMGAVLGAVSPAVVVPRMVQLMDEKYGTDKGVPQMILAGASLDDVFVIVLFTAFVGIAQGNGVEVMTFLNIPISIVAGILLGVAVGFLLACFFETAFSHKYLIRNSLKVIIVLGFAFLLLAVEAWLEKYFSVSGLLAIMSMAIVLAMRSAKEVVTRLQEKFGKLWLAAEVILFVLVGAAVDIRYTLEAGAWALLLIAVCLVFRSFGVWLCMLGTKLNQKERLYCILAYLPKATVQAAIGAVPLSLGLPCGNIVLSVAVLSILITAPLGAIGMDLTYKKLLEREGGCMQTEIKRLKLQKLFNTRDMGGLNAVGGRIKSGKLIRSGKLYKLPKSTVKKLEAFHIQTVIDLRTEQEAAEKPDTVILSANHVNLSLLSAATMGVTFEKDIKRTLKSHGDEIMEQFGTPDEYMAKIYDDILFSEASQENLKAALKIIIEAEGCVLFHCTSGKDRAGVLAMLVESLLGVDEETILLDYAATGEFQKGRNRMFRLFSVFIPLPRKTKKMLMEFLKTNSKHLENAIAKIKARYGSVIDYCKSALGITDENILTMREKYTTQIL